MVRAWYMDNETTDQRLEHHRNPPQFIDLNHLFDLTGVEYFQVRFFFFFAYSTNFRISTYKMTFILVKC